MITEDVKQRKHNKKFWKDRDRLIYTEVGDGLHYFDADGNLQDTDHSLQDRDGDDPVKLWKKISFARLKVGFFQDISDSGWTVGLRGNLPDGTGLTLATAPRAFLFVNRATQDIEYIATAPNSSNGEIIENTAARSEIKYPSIWPHIDLHYVSANGNFDQIFKIHGFDYPVPSGWNEADTYVGFATEINLVDVETERDAETDQEMDTIDFRRAGQRMFFWFSERATRFVRTPQPYEEELKTEQRVIKRLVKRAGKPYLLEILPYSFLAEADYVRGPVVLDYTTKSGSETEDQNWTSGTYYISGSYTLNSYDLVIAAGVIVKHAANVYYYFNNTGYLDVNGTAANPVYFTSKNDNTVGETISGSTGNPEIAEWNKFWCPHGNNNITDDVAGAIFRYGMSSSALFDYDGSGTCTLGIHYSIFTNLGYNDSGNIIFMEIGGHSLTVDNSLFLHNGAGCVIWMDADTGNVDADNVIFYNTFNDEGAFGLFGGGATYTLNNILIDYSGYGDAGISIWHASTASTLTMYNVTINGMFHGAGVFNKWAANNITIKDCIITNGYYGLYDNDNTGNWTTDYNCVSGNRTNYYNGPTKGANSTENPPRFVGMNGSASDIKVSGIQAFLDGFFLDQSNSPCVNAGSRTAAAAGMDSKTTHPDGTADSATVDMGFHWDTFTTGGNGGGGVSIIGKGGPIVKAVS